MEKQELSEYDVVIRDIDQLHDAIVDLSYRPVATRSLLATLEERYNTLAFELQKIAENEKKKWQKEVKEEVNSVEPFGA